MRKPIIVVLALGAIALASCAQVALKPPEEIAELAVYDGAWNVEAALSTDNVANFKGMRNVVACGTWIKQTWTVSSGSIFGTSYSEGNTQRVSGSINADGSWEIRVRTTNGHSYPGRGEIAGDQGSGKLVAEWGRGRVRHCEYEFKLTRVGV